MVSIPNEQKKKVTVNAAYILAVLVFSRFCFWLLAQSNGVTLVEGLCRWDCHWYLTIINNGYDVTAHSNSLKDAANWAFFPLMPLLVKLGVDLSSLTPMFVGFVFANVFHFFAIQMSLRYLNLTRDKVAEHFWVWICCIGPFSFYFSSTYSESLFWFLSCAALLLWQHHAYIRAGLITALLCATRFFGIFWPMAWLAEIFFLGGLKAVVKALQKPQLFFAFAVAPLGLFCFVAYLYLHMGDGLAFVHIQKGWGRAEAPFGAELLRTLSHWTDFSPLFNEQPITRYSFAYFNYFALVGVGLWAWLAFHKRYFEATVAFLLLVVVVKSGLVGIPRYMVGVPVFAFAFHDMVCRYVSPRLRILLLGVLALFNLWLLDNWYDAAYFLI